MDARSRAGGGGFALPVPDPDRLASLTDDELLTAMTAYERATAALAGMSSRAAGLLGARRRAAALAETGPDASRVAVDRDTQEAQAAVVDEIRLATGLNLADAAGRVQLGAASATRAGHVRGALGEGTCTWLMARSWLEATDDLPAQIADAIAHKVLAPTRDGSALSQQRFRKRLGREIARHVPAARRRDHDLDRRDAYATVTPHATGEITVSGSAERVITAIERVDAIARALRGLGDPRTLGQLRSDVMLDLIIFGDIPALPATPPTRVPANPAASPPDPSTPASPPAGGSASAPEWASRFPGGLPPALLHVIVSAAALLELGEEKDAPGRLRSGDYLPAEVIREIAFSAGSTWRRLVTDPVTGEAIELSTTRYAPPPRLREAIQVRDGTCRAPGSHVPAHRCDLDHDTDWAHGGATRADNLSAKSRRAHQHKTAGQWTTHQHPDGSIEWTTGTGRRYTTYPMPYDEDAPGRPTRPDTAPATRPRTAPQARRPPPKPRPGTPTVLNQGPREPGRRGARGRSWGRGRGGSAAVPRRFHRVARATFTAALSSADRRMAGRRRATDQRK